MGWSAGVHSALYAFSELSPMLVWNARAARGEWRGGSVDDVWSDSASRADVVPACPAASNLKRRSSVFQRVIPLVIPLVIPDPVRDPARREPLPSARATHRKTMLHTEKRPGPMNKTTAG